MQSSTFEKLILKKVSDCYILPTEERGVGLSREITTNFPSSPTVTTPFLDLANEVKELGVPFLKHKSRDLIKVTSTSPSSRAHFINDLENYMYMHFLAAPSNEPY